MFEIQLSQMSVAKLTNRFRLQAYLDAIIISYKGQVFLVCNQLGDRKEGWLH